MKKIYLALMCIASFVIMTACGGSPVDNALAKIDNSIEKMEKHSDKMSKEDLEKMSQELEEPLEVLKKAVEDGEVGAITKLKIVAKLTKWTALAAKVGLQNLDFDEGMLKDIKETAPEKTE